MPVKFIIYGKKDCQNCIAAKSILDAKGLSYNYFSIPEDLSREKLAEIFVDSYNVIPRSFPQIETGDVYVGGLQQLVEFLKETKGD